MQYFGDREVFTVAEVSEACGISRTSLIRLEESGFLKPYHTNSDTGYRYYDINNIVEIGRYKRLRNIGLTKNEITGIYYGTVDSARFLEKQRQKVNELQRFVDEFSLRNDHTKCHYSLLTLPAQTCYCEDFWPNSFEDAEKMAHNVYEKVIAEGYNVTPEQPPFIISNDWSAITKDSLSGCRLTCCIHIVPNSRKLQSVHIRDFHESEAFSICRFGDYTILHDTFLLLHEELFKRGLKPAGPVRFIALATNISSQDGYIIRFIAPISSATVNSSFES